MLRFANYRTTVQASILLQLCVRQMELHAKYMCTRIHVSSVATLPWATLIDNVRHNM